MGFDWQAAIGSNLPWGDGQHPTPSYFRLRQSVWQGSGIHDNPRFFKYVWQVFTEADLPSEAKNWSSAIDAVWWAQDRPRMCIAEAMPVIKRLYDAKTPMIVRNKRRKRLGSDTPWDDGRIKWDDPAPGYDEDPDPVWHQHK